MNRQIVFKSLLAGTTLTLTLLGCAKQDESETEVIRPVRYVRVSATTAEVVRTFSGIAEAGIESKLSFRVSGTIQRMLVKVGDVVKKGQLIALLDPTDYRIKVQEAQASLIKALAEARNASANYRRVRALYENQNASRNDLDSARATAESSKAAVQSIEQQLELARRQLNYTRLKTTSECAVAEVAGEVNENVAAGEAVVIVNCGSHIEVKVAVPEVFISQIRKGSPVTVTFDAMAGKRFEASISEVGITSVGMETTFPVTVKLRQSIKEIGGRIRPGMSAEAAFTFGDDKAGHRIVVPSVAVGEDRIGRFVFIVEPEEAGLGVVKRRPVKTGSLTAEGMEISEGIRDGDLVITAGVSRIQDGMEVKLLGATEK